MAQLKKEIKNIDTILTLFPGYLKYNTKTHLLGSR